LAPADYFLFPTLKRELAGLFMSLDEFKTKWEGVMRTLTEDDFAKAFKRWQHRCEVHLYQRWIHRKYIF
jgi:hypothetical protein